MLWPRRGRECSLTKSSSGQDTSGQPEPTIPVVTPPLFPPPSSGEVAPSYGDEGGEPHTQRRIISDRDLISERTAGLLSPSGPTGHLPRKTGEERVGLARLPQNRRTCRVDRAAVGGDRHAIIAFGTGGAHDAVAHVAQHAGRIARSGIA